VITIGLAAMSAACVNVSVPDLAGDWNLRESFADEIHQVSCESQGTLSIMHPASPAPGSSSPGATFTGTLDNNNQCVDPTGPFTYFGQGAVAVGTIATPEHSLSFEANVNEASCEYRGIVWESSGPPSKMTGSLECVLAQAEVVFEFRGEWVAER
jgi:hypothetical protein